MAGGRRPGPPDLSASLSARPAAGTTRLAPVSPDQRKIASPPTRRSGEARHPQATRQSRPTGKSAGAVRRDIRSRHGKVAPSDGRGTPRRVRRHRDRRLTALPTAPPVPRRVGPLTAPRSGRTALGLRAFQASTHRGAPAAGPAGSDLRTCRRARTCRRRARRAPARSGRGLAPANPRPRCRSAGSPPWWSRPRCACRTPGRCSELGPFGEHLKTFAHLLTAGFRARGGPRRWQSPDAVIRVRSARS